MLLLAGLEHIREALAVLQVVVAGQAIAEAVHLVLARVVLLLLVLLRRSLLLLLLLLGLAVPAGPAHQTSHCLVRHLRARAESHATDDRAADSRKHSTAALGLRLNGSLGGHGASGRGRLSRRRGRGRRPASAG